MSNEKSFFEAIQRGDAAAARTLLAAEPGLARARNEARVSALLFAAYCGRGEIARELSRDRSDLDIFEAAALGRTARIAELLRQDPSAANACSPDGFSPLGLAAFFGRLDVLEALIAAGADVNAAAKNAMRVRPLHSAVANRDPDVAFAAAEMLIAAGADVNAAQHGGWTPLHQAAAQRNARLVQLLIARGASPAETSDDGKTARDIGA